MKLVYIFGTCDCKAHKLLRLHLERPNCVNFIPSEGKRGPLPDTAEEQSNG